ncbi:acyl-CoA thioesterase FadM [Sinobacterium caligoides]|uniref:Acyl-CoA thioesterase FadM n=1 Tax=Sinobacterium caligoides TaxID=933926 RepID=A0A3N2DMW3_9GAMM|nr:thioesterase family protein [Sinobacterium caligoides]ROS01156.1 acyl-CoA thioesterase FadM [Sinobacterium caligoides]
MARTVIDLPDTFQYETYLDIYIGHINIASHLGNDSLVSLLNEARCQFLNDLGAINMEVCGAQMINADLAVILKSEAKYGERLRIEIQAAEFQKYGCDFIYRVTEASSERVVAIAKTTMLCFDYVSNQLSTAPNGFAEFFQQTA